MSDLDQGAALAHCDHHWIHRAQPDYPEWLAFIARCSLCDHFGPIDLRQGWAVVRNSEISDPEVTRLRRWKAEASAVLEEWERVYEALGRPGRLGESKAIAVHDELTRLREEAAGLDRKELAPPLTGPWLVPTIDQERP